MVTPLEMYRLPWSLNDNVLAWLEPTKRCNLYCEGCYSRNDVNSDKSLSRVRADLEAIVRQRNVDSVSIAGGDPLVHPDIVSIVKMIREDFGKKPVLNTNGLALDRKMLTKLVDAGVHGFTFHIDSTQRRPKWKGATEEELCELRYQYARMVRDAGDLSVSFNATITPQTLRDVPMLTRWAQRYIDLVDSMVFILFRTTMNHQFDYFAQGRAVQTDDLVYYQEDSNKGQTPLVVNDVAEEIRKADPNFRPAAYLGGTKDPNSMKWVIATRVGTPDRIFGYWGPRSMEMVQTGHHALFGSYLAYSKPSVTRHGRSSTLGCAAFDSGARSTLAAMAKATLKDPSVALSRQHVQSLLIIQPIDMMKDGEMNMCDGCPDMTVHDGELVWSCRLDERLQHGCFLTAAPRGCGRRLQLAPEQSAQPQEQSSAQASSNTDNMDPSRGTA